MRRNLLLLCLCLLPFLAAAQDNRFSSLYFNNGKLQADSSLAISAEQFKIWWKIESNIVATVTSNLTYPQVCLRNGVEGHLLLAFDLTGTEVKNVRVLNEANSYFEEAAIRAIQKSFDIIIKEFQFYQRKTEAKGTYYLPVDFELIDIKKEVKKRGAIPIIQPTLPNFQNRIIEY